MVDKKINIWKWLFLSLISIIIILSIYILFRLNKASDYSEYISDKESVKTEEIEDNLRFETKFTEKQFNNLLMTALTTKNSSYQIYFDKEVHFLGNIEVLDKKLPFELKGRPEALKNGNIMINISNIEAGSFDLPKNLVLKAFAIIIPPETPMKIDVDKGNIIINLVEISREQGVLIKAKNIDSKNNDYKFEITIPKSMISND